MTPWQLGQYQHFLSLINIFYFDKKTYVILYQIVRNFTTYLTLILIEVNQKLNVKFLEDAFRKNCLYFDLNISTLCCVRTSLKMYGDAMDLQKDTNSNVYFQKKYDAYYAYSKCQIFCIFDLYFVKHRRIK